MTASSFGKLMFTAGILICLYFALKVEDTTTGRALLGIVIAVCGLQIVLVNHKPEK